MQLLPGAGCSAALGWASGCAPSSSSRPVLLVTVPTCPSPDLKVVTAPGRVGMGTWPSSAWLKLQGGFCWPSGAWGLALWVPSREAGCSGPEKRPTWGRWCGAASRAGGLLGSRPSAAQPCTLGPGNAPSIAEWSACGLRPRPQKAADSHRGFPPPRRGRLGSLGGWQGSCSDQDSPWCSSAEAMQPVATSAYRPVPWRSLGLFSGLLLGGGRLLFAPPARW